jgi:hypothetical protein
MEHLVEVIIEVIHIIHLLHECSGHLAVEAVKETLHLVRI